MCVRVRAGRLGLLDLLVLLDGGAGEDVEVVGVGGGDARCDFVVGGGADHGGVVAAEGFIGEEDF